MLLDWMTPCRYGKLKAEQREEWKPMSDIFNSIQYRLIDEDKHKTTQLTQTRLGITQEEK